MTEPNPPSWYRLVAGKTYEVLRASDLNRDGMALEVYETRPNPLMVVFYSDQTDQMTVSCFKEDLPIEFVEEVLAIARQSLPPVKENSN